MRFGNNSKVSSTMRPRVPGAPAGNGGGVDSADKVFTAKRLRCRSRAFRTVRGSPDPAHSPDRRSPLPLTRLKHGRETCGHATLGQETGHSSLVLLGAAEDDGRSATIFQHQLRCAATTEFLHAAPALCVSSSPKLLNVQRCKYRRQRTILSIRKSA